MLPPSLRNAGLFAALVLLPLAAGAHEQGAIGANAFLTGFLHPLGGLDHMLAMLAVGMWGALLGMPALWLLPVAFPLLMAVGGVLGMVGFPLPTVELGIALSVLVLGAVIAINFRAPLWVSLLVVSFFAIFHGYAHGVELPAQTNPLSYSLGFVVATGLIHLAGIGIGMVTHLPRGMLLLRAGGGAIAAAGAFLLV